MFDRLPSVFHNTPKGLHEHQAHVRKKRDEKVAKAAAKIVKRCERDFSTSHGLGGDSLEIPIGKKPKSMTVPQYVARVCLKANEGLREGPLKALMTNYGASLDASAIRNNELDGVFNPRFNGRLRVVVDDSLAHVRHPSDLVGV